MSKRDVYFMLLPAYEGDSNARVEGPFTRGEIGAEIARLAKDYDGLRFVERVLDEDDNDVDSDEYTVAIIRGSFVVPKPVDVVKTWKVDE